MTSSQQWSRLLDAVSRPSAARDADALLNEAVLLGLEVAPSSVGCSITQQLGEDYRTPVASGPLAMDLDLAQYRADNGPCIAAARSGRHVQISSMAAEADFPEFTEFMAAARRHGVQSSSSVPLLGSARPAALNLYASEPDAFAAERPAAVASLLARCITGLLQAGRRPSSAGEVRLSVTDALAKRELIEKAQQVLTHQDELSEAQAFSVLAQRSKQQCRSIFEVAQAVLDTEPGSGR